MSDTTRPLRVGHNVAPYGRIGAIGMVGDERYYWLIDSAGAVAMIPADTIEALNASTDA